MRKTSDSISRPYGCNKVPWSPKYLARHGRGRGSIRQRIGVGRSCVLRSRRCTCGVAGASFHGERSGTDHNVCNLRAASECGTPPLLDRATTGHGKERTVVQHDMRATVKVGVNCSGHHELDTAGGCAIRQGLGR